MKKRTAVIAALVSLMPLGQTVLIGTGAALTSTAVMLSVPEKAQAESAGFYYNRANQKSRDGDYYGAISDYSKAIEVNPYHPQVHWFYNNRGFSKGELKDRYGAISDYTKAIAINPNDDFAYHRIFLTFKQQQRICNHNVQPAEHLKCFVFLYDWSTFFSF